MKKLTKRQEAIEAGRIQDVETAARMARLINDGYGHYNVWQKTLPQRQWIRGNNGLWHSEGKIIQRKAA
jgi:hypothetical protein